MVVGIVAIWYELGWVGTVMLGARSVCSPRMTASSYCFCLSALSACKRADMFCSHAGVKLSSSSASSFNSSGVASAVIFGLDSAISRA